MRNFLHLIKYKKINDLFSGDFWNNNILYQFNHEVIVQQINEKFFMKTQKTWRNEIFFLQGIAEDIKILDWQLLRYASPAIDLITNLFTSTDKSLRDKEYDNLIKLYYESLSKTVKLLGSEPNELFTFENLQNELKRCGIYALILSPFSIQTSQADSSQITSFDEMSEKSAKGEVYEFITGLSEKGYLEYQRRLNDVFDDIDRLGYYRKLGLWTRRSYAIIKKIFNNMY